MKPLLLTVAFLLLTHHASLETAKEDDKEIDPKTENEGDEQTREGRCTTCASATLSIKAPSQVLSALQNLPITEVHSQSSFEGCSSDKGCAGVKVKDGQVIEKYGNLDAFKAAQAADSGSEFSFRAAGNLADVFSGGVPKNGPFWWMNENSPFKSVSSSGGNFEKFSKSSSSSFSTSGSGGTGSGGSLDLSGNPFLNGEFLKGAGTAEVKPGTSKFQSSSFESSSAFNSGSNGELDLSKNPFLSGKFGGGFEAGGVKFGVQGTTGYVGSTPGPFTASTAGSNVNLIQNDQKNQFEYTQNAQSSGQSFGSAQTGFQNSGQDCSAQNYECVARHQCINGVANVDGIGIIQSRVKKTQCNSQTEVCCRVDATISANAEGSSSGSAFLSSNSASGAQGAFTNTGSNAFGSTSSSKFNAQGSFGGSQTGSNIASGTFGTNSNTAPGSFGSNFNSGSGSGSFGSKVNTISGSNSFGVTKGSSFGSSSSSFENHGTSYTGSAFGSTQAPSFDSASRFGTKVSGSSQSNFISDSSSAGSESASIYRPGAPGTISKPGVPYLPPVDSSTAQNVIISTAVPPTPSYRPPPPPTTARPVFTTQRATYLPPSSTAAPGYLPPVPEQTIHRETKVPPNPNYIDGSLILDATRTTPRTTQPFVPVDIPAGCAAALKCTPIEYCTAEGVISTTTIILTKDQESYRVPLTDCKDLESGLIGKCCRDPNYSDPWPANLIGKWTEGVFGGNDGKYTPDNSGSGNNPRPQVTARPPITGSTILPNYRKDVTPFGPNQVTPGYGPTQSTVQKGQYEIRNQGRFEEKGEGKYSVGGAGKYAVGGQGQLEIQGQGSQGQFGQVQGQKTFGQGQFETQGQGSKTQFGQGQFGIQGQGSKTQFGQGQFGVQGQGSKTQFGQGQLEIQGQGSKTQFGQGQFGVQGQGSKTQFGQGQLEIQGQGSKTQFGQGQFGVQGQGSKTQFGQGQLEIQGQGSKTQFGQGQFEIQGQGSKTQFGQGQLEIQGQGSKTQFGQGQLEIQGQGSRTQFGQVQGQGQGQIQGQGSQTQFGQSQKTYGQTVVQGEGQLVTQGFGTGIRQGQGVAVRQGGGYSIEEEYALESRIYRLFLQRWSGSGECGILNGQKPNGDRNELEVDFAEIPWQAMVLLQTNRSLLCGGVITRPDVVLTTASCVEGLLAKNVLIKGGEWKLAIDDEPLPFQIVQVKNILRHPEYRKGSFENDVAILVLTENLRLAKNIWPICLPGARDTFDAFYSGNGECIVTGWGQQVLQAHISGSILHSIAMSLIRPEECQSRLSQEYPHLLSQYHSDSCVCGQPSNPVNNVCKVDTGSALACTNGDGHYVLRGVYDWDSGCQPGNQIAGFYKFDLEWYEWAIGLGESARFAQYAQASTVQNQIASQVNNGFGGGGFPTGTGIVSGSSAKGFRQGSGGSQTFQTATTGSGIGVGGAKGFATGGQFQQGFRGSQTFTSSGSQGGLQGSQGFTSSGAQGGATGAGGEGVTGSGVLTSGGGGRFQQSFKGSQTFTSSGSQGGLTSGSGDISGATGLGSVQGFGSRGQFQQGAKGFGISGTLGGVTGSSSVGGISGTTGSGSFKGFASGQFGTSGGQGGISGSGISGAGGKFEHRASESFSSSGSLGGSSGIGGAISGSDSAGAGSLGVKGSGSGFGQFSTSGFGQVNAPVQNTFSATYSEKKFFKTEPKIITYTTKPEIVTFTTKPEIFTYTTKPKLITYTTKPQIITYETSGSGQSPQYVAPGSSLNPTFGSLVGHNHSSQCKCLENGKK